MFRLINGRAAGGWHHWNGPPGTGSDGPVSQP